MLYTKRFTIAKPNRVFDFEAKKKNNVNFDNQSPRNYTVEKLGSLNNIKGGEGLGHKKRISRNWRGIDFVSRLFKQLLKNIKSIDNKLYLDSTVLVEFVQRINKNSIKSIYPRSSSYCAAGIGMNFNQININN